VHNIKLGKELISIVVPVYKSVNSLKELVEQVKSISFKNQLEFELIFVNDSPSFIATSNCLEKLCRKFSFVKHIKLRKNQGQHIAVVVGLLKATGKYIITMDDDLQHPVSELNRLITIMDNNNKVDAIFAVSKNRNHNWWRNLGSRLLVKVDKLIDDVPDHLVKSSFRIMKKEIADAVCHNFGAMPSVSSLIIQYTHNIINVEVAHNIRKYGSSNYNLRTLIKLSFNKIINYSSLPLKVVGFIGFMFSIIIIVFVGYTIAKKLVFGVSFPGYTSLVTIIGLLGSINLLAMGLVGEYLIRILKEIQKPHLSELIAEEYNFKV